MRAFFAATILAAAGQAAAADPLPFDTGLFEPFDINLQMMVGEEEMGAMRLAARFEDGMFVVEDRTTMQPNIEETYRLEADPETFAPRALRINFVAGASSQVVDLAWEADHARGAYVIDDGSGAGPRTVEFDRSTEGALARASLFALAPTLPLVEGSVYSHPWFASMTGQVEQLQIMVGPERRVETPAGDFDAVPLVFRNVSPENVLYVTLGAERRLVRIDVPAMNMRFLLLPEGD